MAFSGTPLYSISLDGVKTDLAASARPSDNSGGGSLLIGQDGNLYGTLGCVDAPACTMFGAIFVSDLLGNMRVIYTGTQLSDPDLGYIGNLVQAPDGTLYGNGFYGSGMTLANGIFGTTTAGDLVYQGANNNNISTFIVASDGSIYGVSSSNGDYNLGYFFKAT